MTLYLDSSALAKRYIVEDESETEASDLAWKHGLRGYDAVQLAAALAWRETTRNTEENFVFACFDRKLQMLQEPRG